MFATTLRKIQPHALSENSWNLLLAHLGKTEADDEPVLLQTILDSNGLSDTLWYSRTVDTRLNDILLFGIWCVRQIQHLVPEDAWAAVDIAEKYARGEAIVDEMATAETEIAQPLVLATNHGAKSTTAWAVWAVWAITRKDAGAAAWAALITAGSAGQDARHRQEQRFRQMLAEGAFIGSTAPETCAA